MNHFLFGQELPRQGNWGIYVNELTDSTKSAHNLKYEGVQVIWIRPNSTEEKIGLKAGDILLQMNDFKVQAVADVYFSGFLSFFREGDQICYHIIRENEKKKLCGTIDGKPYETNEKLDIIYDKVPFSNGHLSTILTKPKVDEKHKLPAIYFIPGYNCASYDNMTNFHPYRKLIDSLTQLGYAVFRCEKSGMGDSHNTPNCFEIDFGTEQFGFEKGYEKLLTYDFIDTSQIFIFGHSLGGINAPLLAEKYKPKGIVVYGTTHLPWMEYLQNMLRFQNSKLGIPPVQMAQEMKMYQSILHKIFVEKINPRTFEGNDITYWNLLYRDFQYVGDDMFLQRDFSYHHELNELNLTESWSNVECHVLSIFGEADFEALNPESHKEIEKIVNFYHPGKAKFIELKGTNHNFIQVGNMESEIQSRLEGTGFTLMKTNFNYDIITIIDDWIKSLDQIDEKN